MFRKWLEKLFHERLTQLESRVEEHERQLKRGLDDVNEALEKTYRLHQRLVKRASRELEGLDGPSAPQAAKTDAEAINERIRLRRLRGRSNGVLTGVPGAQ